MWGTPRMWGAMGGGLLLAMAWAVVAARADVPAGTRSPGDVSSLPVLGAAPDFHLRSLEGPGVRLQDLRGKIVLSAFACSHCADEPATVAEGFVRLQHALKGRGIFGRKVALAFVVRHPEHETRTAIREFAARLGVDPYGWLILGGSLQGTMRLRDQFSRIAATGATEAAETRGRVFLLDYAGRVRRVYTPAAFQVDAVLADLERLL